MLPSSPSLYAVENLPCPLWTLGIAQTPFLPDLPSCCSNTVDTSRKQLQWACKRGVPQPAKQLPPGRRWSGCGSPAGRCPDSHECCGNQGEPGPAKISLDCQCLFHSLQHLLAIMMMTSMLRCKVSLQGATTWATSLTFIQGIRILKCEISCVCMEHGRFFPQSQH